MWMYRGTMVKPTPGAGTNVTGVVCNARICAEERLTTACGRSAATSARNVGGPAPPEEGPAKTKPAFWLASESVNPMVPFVVSGEPAIAADKKAGTVSVMAIDVTVPVPAGRSAVTRLRKLGAAAPPEVGPA